MFPILSITFLGWALKQVLKKIVILNEVKDLFSSAEGDSSLRSE
jgi:hypothetical protein